MRFVLRVMSVAAAVALSAASEAGVKTDKSEPPSRLASFEISRPVRKAEAITARVTAAIEAVTGQKMERPAVIPPAMAQTMRRMRVTAGEAPGLQIVYLPEVDELRVVDSELAVSTAPEREIKEDEARAVAKRTFDNLAKSKVLNAEDDAWDRADVGSTWVGGGSVDGKVDAGRKRVEYRVTARRVINRIEVANAGVRIAVHATGRVSGVRIGHVDVASRRTGNTEEPASGKGKWMERKVSIRDLDARFEREMAQQTGRPKVAWSKVMYVLPDDQRTAVVEPLYLVSYSLHVPTDDGEVAISRRKTIGYSLTDPAAPPIDFTPPAKQHEVDKEKRTERPTS